MAPTRRTASRTRRGASSDRATVDREDPAAGSNLDLGALEDPEPVFDAGEQPELYADASASVADAIDELVKRSTGDA